MVSRNGSGSGKVGRRLFMIVVLHVPEFHQIHRIQQGGSNECRNNFPKLMLIERRLFWSNRDLRAGIAGREEGAAP